TLGAALLILAGASSPINRFVLGNRVMVSVGLISYSLYLWHWPVLLFGQHALGGAGSVPTRATTLALVALAFALSIVTYHIVEKPLRFGFPSHRRQVAFSLAGAMAGAALIGVVTYTTHGWAIRYP